MTAGAKMAPLDRRALIVLAGLLFLCQAVGIVSGFVTRPAIWSWYAELAKPGFTPPNWLFAPVWTLLYALMAVAVWLVWRMDGRDADRRAALIAFAVQLVLNSAWSFAFFGAQSPVLGLVVIVALEVAIIFVIIIFARLSRGAAWLMVPYAAWVAYASALNLAIVALNS